MLQDVPNVIGGRVHSHCARNLASCRQAFRLDTSTVCDMCDLGEDENVEHFLLYCNKYSNIRQSFIENLKKVNVYLNHMDDNSKLYFILNIENQALLICNYVSQLLKERNL